MAPPLAKRSGAPSPNVGAYSRNAVRSNEIAGFVIITFWNAITERRLNCLSRFGSGLSELAANIVLCAAYKFK